MIKYKYINFFLHLLSILIQSLYFSYWLCDCANNYNANNNNNNNNNLNVAYQNGEIWNIPEIRRVELMMTLITDKTERLGKFMCVYMCVLFYSWNNRKKLNLEMLIYHIYRLSCSEWEMEKNKKYPKLTSSVCFLLYLLLTFYKINNN